MMSVSHHRLFAAFVLAQSLCTGLVYGQESEAIADVVLHPFASTTFVCAEHAKGEFTDLGNALGKDCLIIRNDTIRIPERRLPSLFRGDGAENEDWFGWEVPLLAPCDAIVYAVHANPKSNQPGMIPDRDALEPASEIHFECEDDTRVVYAHVRNIQVRIGESVQAGDVVAEIGNNAVSTAPHVHIGAWKDETPLQIRFDLHALGNLRRQR